MQPEPSEPAAQISIVKGSDVHHPVGPDANPISFRALFFFLVAVILLLSDKGQIAGDGVTRWNALVALAEDHRLTPDKYTLVQPMLATPLYAVGALIASVDDTFHNVSPAERREHRIHSAHGLVARFNKVIAFLIVVLLFRMAVVAFGFNDFQAAGTVLALLFGSMLIPNARDYYSECLWTLLSLAALYMLSKPTERLPRSEGIALAVTVASSIPLNPILFWVLGGVLAVVLMRTARGHRVDYRALYGAVGLFAGLAATLAENYVRRGGIFRTGYEREGFTTPLLTGLWGELAAPSRGVVFFIPAFLLGPLLLALYRQRLSDRARIFVQLSLLYSCGLILAYATWWSWHGSWYWGPRFLLPLSVFGAIYLALLVKHGWPSRVIRVVAVSVATASFLIYKVGAAINQRHLLECLRSAVDENTCYWSWVYSPMASLFARADVHDMLVHRSTAVEAFTVVLVVLCGIMFRQRRHQ
ncbi:MAG TPA: hypothetical protein VEZ11_03900 [Thermoanaerobaculia bacterium]|nr:hypothetical protein [Thermoanaerobaculia bacterium]